MKIVKKDGTLEDYNEQKIINACDKAARRAMIELSHKDYTIILNSVWQKIEENYEIFVKTQDLSGLMAAYQEVLVNQDQQVRVLEPGHEYTGVARGINAMGELLVEKEDGTITEVYAGEVSVRGLYGYV